MYLKYALLVLVFVSYSSAQGFEEDDPDGEAYVEEEREAYVDDVAYQSPVPSKPERVYFADHFDDAQEVDNRWVRSEAKKEGTSEEISKYDGIWKTESPEKDALNGDLGLVLKSNARHAAISSKLNRPFIFEARPFIVQYEVIFQDGQECGGAYLKLLSDGPQVRDLKQFHDKTPYTIMFGPDKCGNDHKLHFIFRHRNPLNGSYEEKHCRKPRERIEEFFKDKLPHLYTLIINPDNTFEILVDNSAVNSGSLLEDFAPPVNPPPEIDDPNDKKPADWDERERIPDPDSRKPDDWDETAPAQIIDTTAVKPDDWLEDEPPTLPDPAAVKPDDWDSEMDGEWEAPLIDNPACESVSGCGKWEPPLIDNPDYKGKWSAPLIDNPNYKGKWKPRRIPNPDFFEDKKPYKMHTISAVGFELWSMSKNILFDNLIITDDIDVARQWAAETFDLKRKKIGNVSESFVVRLLRYAQENPWMWLVYTLVIGVPISLYMYLCCRPKKTPSAESSEEKEELLQRTAHTKKTDDVTEDDQKEEVTEEGESVDKEKTPSDEEGEGEGEDEGEESVQKEDDTEEKISDVDVHEGGDLPRKRHVRKE